MKRKTLLLGFSQKDFDDAKKEIDRAADEMKKQIAEVDEILRN
jgi:flavin-binding protein dodecin